MNVFEKVCRLSDIEVIGDAEHTLRSMAIGADLVPPPIVVDVVEAGTIKEYVIQNPDKFLSEADIRKFFFEVIKTTVNASAFSDPKSRNTFPMLGDFFYFCQRANRSGEKDKKADLIAGEAWYGYLAQIHKKRRFDLIFSTKPDETVFNATHQKIKSIWGYSDYEMDSIRYFACQVKEPDFIPMQNKHLFFYSKEKRTGKTTVASSIICALNGESNISQVDKYSSTLPLELQFSKHDKPLAITSNCVLLDEAMPDDSRKVYGNLKTMLTSQGCIVDIKHGAQVNVQCRRNYIFLSNFPPSDYIKDDKERRLLGIIQKSITTRISFEEIFELWRLFCIHATPRKPFADWDLDFKFIDGQLNKNKDEVISSIVNDPLILGRLEEQGAKVPIGYFYQLITGNKSPNRDQKPPIKAACEELFGQGSEFPRFHCIKVITERQKVNPFETDEPVRTQDLPF